MIAKLIAPIDVRSFSEIFFDGEAKEAVAFALLAHLHVNGRTGNVPRATGARGGRILGKLTPRGVPERRMKRRSENYGPRTTVRKRRA